MVNITVKPRDPAADQGGSKVMLHARVGLLFYQTEGSDRKLLLCIPLTRWELKIFMVCDTV